jgi:serine/threonine-protein kinase HipA
MYCYEKLTAEIDYHEQCSIKIFGTKKAPILSYSLSQMNDLAKDIIDRSIAVPGVQPKLSLSILTDAINKQQNARLTVVGALGGNYILKPPSQIYPEMPQNEHLTMRLAEAFGIKTVSSSLILMQSGELAYIIERIDRTEKGEKIHMLDMYQILEAVDKYKSSIERVGKAIGKYSSNTLMDQLAFFELCLFCFVTGNNDMHLKNFSMINLKGKWLLAPAYDLLNVDLANPDDNEELALTLEGKKKKITREHFERLGKSLELNEKQIENVFNRFKKNSNLADSWIKKSFLTKESQLKYIAILKSNYEKIKL